MRNSQTAEPFSLLGERLRQLRSDAQETLADTSGAVEIEVNQLISYELGRSRPSEEVLLLLINHFKPQDVEALKLWKLAGYASEAEPADGLTVLYTDSIEINASRLGVTIDFLQSTNAGVGPKSVSRIGMSREQAESLLKTLMIALTKANQQNQRLLSPKDEPETPKADIL